MNSARVRAAVRVVSALVDEYEVRAARFERARGSYRQRLAVKVALVQAEVQLCAARLELERALLADDDGAATVSRIRLAA